jgi:hypothetical protein
MFTIARLLFTGTWVDNRPVIVIHSTAITVIAVWLWCVGVITLNHEAEATGEITTGIGEG